MRNCYSAEVSFVPLNYNNLAIESRHNHSVDMREKSSKPSHSPSWHQSSTTLFYFVLGA